MWLFGPISALFVALVGVLAIVTTSDPHKKIVTYPSHVEIKPSSYIVEFEDHLPTTHADNFHTMPGVNVHHQYEHVFNGISVKTQNEIDATHLASVDGVKRVWPVRYYKLQKTNSSSASSFPFVHQPTGVNQAIKRLGMTGKGVKVGIVDTGVDYSHPELGNCWKTPGCPWQYGEDFIGDSYNPKDPDTAIKPNPTPMDCDGHGTHVSGIIAGQGPTVYGVAPGVTLGMYRVFSCPAADGSTHTSEDIIIKALESAVKDNHDIINMSLGGGGWPFEPISIACTNAVKRGITVVAAIGNDSVGGLHSASAPAVAEGVISVGSVSNWNDTGAMATVTTAQSSKSVFISMPVIPGKAFVFDSATPLAAPLDLAGSSLGCSNITDDLSGKIAVLMRGTCLIETKGKMAQNAGAIGVVLVNNVPGIVYPAIEHPFDIPMVVVPTADGQFMMEGISHGATTIVAHKYNTSTIPIESGGQVSTFSSIGPDPLLNISPHILAPGGNIYSTFPLKKEGYAILSGTSMAAPYVVGAVALLKEARPELSVSELDMLLSTTAKPALLAINESIAHPYAGGSGLLNVYNAIKARAKISPPRLSINSTTWGPISGLVGTQYIEPVRWTARIITIENTDKAKSVHVSSNNNAADSLSMFFPNGSIAYKPRVWSSNGDNDTEPMVYAPEMPESIAAGATEQFTVFIIAPKGLKESDKWYFGGYINFKLQWENEASAVDYNIPYAGFNGDFAQLNPINLPDTGLPVIVDMNDDPVENVYELAISRKAPAKFRLSIAVPSQLATIKLVDANDNVVGYLPNGYHPFVPHTCPVCQSASFLPYAINGIAYTDKNSRNAVMAPTGTYHIHVSVLRPFGDINNASHYQIWDSPEFRIE